MNYLELHLGPMFSGKTTHLNQLASQAVALHQRVELWLPPMSEAGVKNSEKNKDVSLLPSSVIVRYLADHEISINHLEALHPPQNQIHVVLIDETHFFDSEALFNLITHPFKENHPYAKSSFFCFGLNGTYQLTAWPTITRLLPIASKIRHYRAICSRCGYGTKAPFSNLKQEVEPDSIKIEGGSDLYEALCHHCFPHYPIIKD